MLTSKIRKRMKMFTSKTQCILVCEMASCESCDLDYVKAMSTFYEKDEIALSFLRNHGVLPKEVKCPKCNNLCKS